jgi:Uma2 family endonuclease
VRADNTHIIQNDAIYGTPDLIIEIVSEHDRPVNLMPLEADYRDIGVPEILFIDPLKQRVRYLAKTETDFDEMFLTTGTLQLASVPGFHIEVEWLFLQEKPDELTLVNQLVAKAENGDR